jgi:hypothetical protein
MREQIMRVTTIAILVSLLGFGTAFAQDEDQPESQENGVTVVSYFKCYQVPLEQAVQKFKETNTPYLNNLVEEGKLDSWGMLTHYWGDSWNLIVYYNTSDMASFEDAFSNFINSVMEDNPNVMSEWADMCSEHKDNIYGQAYNYSGEEM